MPSIGTHDGKFHADEVLACALLKCLPQFKGHDIKRTRDPNVLADCEVVVDVGAVYNHAQLRYDHHQKTFQETMQSLGVLDFTTKLSSAGLIYAHYGKQIIAEVLDLPRGSSPVDKIFEKTYESFVEAIDAVDNGIAQFDGEPRYYMGGTLSARINRINPSWNEESANPDKQFLFAIGVAQDEFMDLLGYLHKSWLPAYEIVLEAIKQRFKVDESGQIFEIKNGGVPWKDHFFAIEKELQLENDEIAYCLFCDSNSNNWRLMTVPPSASTLFEIRVPFPMSWRGLRDAELSEIANIPECVFVHASGFTSGTKERHQAIEMARQSLIIAGKYKGAETKKPDKAE